MEGGLKYIMEELKHENANYLPAMKKMNTNKSVMEMELDKSCCNNHHNETWNSHGYVPTSPCGKISSSHSSLQSITTTASTASSSSSPMIPNENGDDETLNFNSMRNQRENDHGEEEESFISNRLALAFSTPMPRNNKNLPRTTACLRFKSKKHSTPRKVVARKPPVSSALSGKGTYMST
jgi:hypothetical protein